MTQIQHAFVIRPEDVAGFAEVSGDTNPIHLDPDAAGDQGFGVAVAHGMHLVGKVSGILSPYLPDHHMAQAEVMFPNAAPVGAMLLAEADLSDPPWVTVRVRIEHTSTLVLDGRIRLAEVTT